MGGPLCPELGSYMFSEMRFCASWEDLCLTLQWNDMHGQWREHITKKRCFSETSHTTGTKEERK